MSNHSISTLSWTMLITAVTTAISWFVVRGLEKQFSDETPRPVAIEAEKPLTEKSSIVSNGGNSSALEREEYQFHYGLPSSYQSYGLPDLGSPGQSILRGDPYNLAKYDVLGWGDIDETRWLAEQRGDAEAQYRMGLLYSSGSGVLRDKREAVKWYRMAAQQGHASAQERLGNAYRHGWGVERNFEEAIKWYRMAAEQGDLEAKRALKELKVE